VEGPSIETARLVMRPPIEADLDAFAELLGNPESAAFFGGPVPRAAAWRSMATMTGAWSLRGFGMFSVVERASGRCIGRLGPWQPEGWPGTEVGWGLIREAWGKGYATEGATAAIDWAFEALGWTDVIHTIAPGNMASIAVAKRLGSERRGPVTLPPPLDTWETEAWGQTREQWYARKG